MNRVTSFFRGFAAKAGSPESVGRVLFCAVALVLATGSAGAVPVVQVDAASQAAGPVAERFHFSVVIPGTLCAGRDYPLKATMLADLQLPAGGSPDQFQDRVVPGINIEAKVDDTSIASITPPSASSGFIQTDLLIPPSVDNANGLGQVVFTLHAKKAGATNLSLKATIPGQLTGGASPVIPAGGAINVENCKYKITVKGSWSRQYPNLTTRLAESLQGEFTRNDSDKLNGTANVTWELRSASLMCSHSHSITLGQATLSGEQNETNLHVMIKYDAFELMTVNCGSSTEGKIQVPPLDLFEVPTTGITGGLPVPFPVGNEQLQGIATIIIVPIPIQ